MGRHPNPLAAAAATLSAQQKDAATIAALQRQLDTLTAHLDAQTKTHAAQLTQARIEADEQQRKHALALEKLERQHAIRTAELTGGKRGTAPTFGRMGSMPTALARTTSLVRANSQLLGGGDSHAALADSSASAPTSDLAVLRSQLEHKDALLSALQSRFDAQSLELHKSVQSCARLQTHVDLINRQIRFGDDYKTLLKYATVRAYVRQYREYARAKELHRALADVMQIVAEHERVIGNGGTATKSQRGSTVTSPSKAASAANPPSPPQRFSLTQPAAGSTADSTVLPVVQTSLSAEPSLVNPAAAASSSRHVSSRRSSAAATFADLAAHDSTEHGSASGHSGSAGPQNEVAEWMASDRGLWSAEKVGFAKLATVRRERADRLAFQLQYSLQPAYRDPAAASAASSSSSSFTAPSSVTPSARLSRLEAQRLREMEKRRRAAEESGQARTFNAWTHWGAKHAAIVAEAPALLGIALQDAYARESTARATTKLWQQRNTQLLLDCAALQNERGVALTGSRKESTRVQQLEAALQDALSKVCVCTKIAAGMGDGAQGRCLCDCMEDCSCIAASSFSSSQSQSQSQAARTKARKNQRRMDQQQWRAENAAKLDAADGGGVTEESKTDPFASAGAVAPVSPSGAASASSLNATPSLASLLSQFGTSLGGGRNARTHGLLNQHSNFPLRRPAKSQHASPNKNLQHSFSAASLDAQPPQPAVTSSSLSSSASSVDVSSAPFLQRIIRTLRSRLFFSRNIILQLQADKESTGRKESHGKTDESAGQQDEETAEGKRASINSGSSSAHATPQKPHPPHTERSHAPRSVHRAHPSRPSSSHGSPRASAAASADPLPPLHAAQPNGSPSSHAQLLSRQHASVTSLSQPVETAACPALSLSSSTRAGLTARLNTDLEAQFQRSVSQVQAASAEAPMMTPRKAKQQYQLHPSPPIAASSSTPTKRHSWSSHPLAPLPLHTAVSPFSRQSLGVTGSPSHRSSAKVHLLQSMAPKSVPASSQAATAPAAPAVVD